MPSLRDPRVNAAIRGRIEGLAPDARPEWGALTAARMLAHCVEPLRLAAGEIAVKRIPMGYLMGGFARRRFIDGGRRFPRNAPTDPSFLPDATGFEEQRAELLERVRAYADAGAATTAPHPFFGRLTAAQWDELMWKHLDHHLAQFGA